MVKTLIHCELAVDCEEGWAAHVTDGGQEFCAKNIGRYAGDIAQSKCEEFDADLPWPKTERENTDLRSLLVYLGGGS